MTPEARRLVQESWPRAAGAADALAVRFYARLFEIEPAAHRLFASTDMTLQRQKLVDMLRAIVAVLGEGFTPALRDAWAEAYALLASVMKRAAITARVRS